MRLGRLVAAGLVAGAVAGFVGALLRPRTVRSYDDLTAAPATPASAGLRAATDLAYATSASSGAAVDGLGGGVTAEEVPFAVARRLDVDELGATVDAASGPVRTRGANG